MADTLVTTQSQEQALRVTLVSKNTYTNYLSQEQAEQYGFKANHKQTFLLPHENRLLVGADHESQAKNADPFDTPNPYQLGAVVVRALGKSSITELEVEGVTDVTSEQDEDGQQQWLTRFLLGMHQAAWHYDPYLSQEKSPRKELIVSVGEADRHLVTKEVADELYALHTGIALTRHVIDTPPEDMNPNSIQDEVSRELDGYDNVDVQIFSEEQLRKKGMNGILAVGRGSRWAPTMVHATVSPQKEVKHRVCLVGKGITYDSGGLDIKYAGLMKGMKADLGGAATMFGTTKALAELELEHTEVHWISPFVENMPNGNSYKSDDIIRTYSGQTVEIINTDAEGRIILSDALAYATLLDPDYIVDAATLTGAAMFSLSEHVSGLMCNDYELGMKALRTFEQEQEMTSYVPMSEVLRGSLKGSMSDIRSLAQDRMAGHIIAGLFLSHFVDQNLFRNEDLGLEEKRAYPWFHLDIAGSAMNEGKNDLMANGASGQSVRSLVRFITQNDV
ncbi:MAG: hypothetical protein BRC23_02110 [Parcubacteria group bacterium SW_4_49_11]|nr:MAG: hypothetical protein BRC23_02110 [Parcubacteria group bacterium SW_4_49_11]